MNEFPQRWQACAAVARTAEEGAVEEPAGLATRVWARWQAQSAATITRLWPVLSFRALLLASLVLAASLAAELASASAANGSVFEPHLEDLVTSVWSAS